MKYLLLIILAAFFCVAFHPQPKEVVTVKVVVQQGDVLQNIIWKLKEKYGDIGAKFAITQDRKTL